jgi:hypothetical protein
MSLRAQYLTIKSAGHLAGGWVCAPNTPSSLAPLSFTRPEGTKQEDRMGG